MGLEPPAYPHVAAPRLAELRTWLDRQRARLPFGRKLAGALRYSLKHWPALTRYIDDGRIEIDNNPAERTLRSVAVGRKNYLFAGSDAGGERAAVIYNLIETAKLSGVNPSAWLTDVIGRFADHPARKINYRPGRGRHAERGRHRSVRERRTHHRLRRPSKSRNH